MDRKGERCLFTLCHPNGRLRSTTTTLGQRSYAMKRRLSYPFFQNHSPQLDTQPIRNGARSHANGCHPGLQVRPAIVERSLCKKFMASSRNLVITAERSGLSIALCEFRGGFAEIVVPLIEIDGADERPSVGITRDLAECLRLFQLHGG